MSAQRHAHLEAVLGATPASRQHDPAARRRADALRSACALLAVASVLGLVGCAAAPRESLQALPVPVPAAYRQSVDDEVFRIRVMVRELRLQTVASTQAKPTTVPSAEPVLAPTDGVAKKKDANKAAEAGEPRAETGANGAGLAADEPAPEHEQVLQGVASSPLQLDDVTVDRKGAEAELERASRSCELADAICSSAYSICAISEDAGSDVELAATCIWAVGECDVARAQCNGAR